MTAVTVDKFGDANARRLFAEYVRSNLPTFRQFAIALVEAQTCSSKDKKAYFARQINSASTKDKVLKIVTNIFLAGEGLAVV